MDERTTSREQALGRRRTVARLRALITRGRTHSAGMRYWQAGGSTRAAVKRVKRA